MKYFSVAAFVTEKAMKETAGAIFKLEAKAASKINTSQLQSNFNFRLFG